MPSELIVFAAQFAVSTSGKGTYEITGPVRDIVRQSGVEAGQVTVFVRHTSASLVIMENADPSARSDLHAFFDRLVPENLPYLVHTLEGPDDSPSHLRMALTRSSEVIPVILPSSAAASPAPRTGTTPGSRWRRTTPTN